MLKNIIQQEGLAESVLIQHEETVSHMLRVSHLARDFGTYLKLKEKDIKLLEKCALLHDIGKLSISKEILYKKGKLTEEEFEVVKTHTQFEVKYCENNKVINNCIGGHHLSCNNKGYGVFSNYRTLHRNTKIVSILDVYDVMSNKRSYKDFEVSQDDILFEINKCKGIQFNKFYANEFIRFIQTRDASKKVIDTMFY